MAASLGSSIDSSSQTGSLSPLQSPGALHEPITYNFFPVIHVLISRGGGRGAGQKLFLIYSCALHVVGT